MSYLQKWRAWLPLLVIIAITPNLGHALSCSSIPTTTSAGATPILSTTGSLTVGSGSTVNGTSVTTSGSYSLPTSGTTSNASTALPGFLPASFPTASLGSGTITTSGTVAAGSYGTINASGTPTVFSGGTYYINTLNVNMNKSIRLAAGDYFINTLTLQNNSQITVSSGPVRMFVKTLFDGQNNNSVNPGGSAADFQLYLYGSAAFHMKNNNAFVGLIYAPYSGAQIEFEQNSSIAGAILSAGQVALGSNTVIAFDSTVQSAIAAISSCGLVADYHFDECSYNGTSGEVVDSRGKYPATSKGAVPSTRSDGVVGGRSLDLNALNKYVTPNSKIPLPGDYTLSMWLKLPLPSPAGNSIYASSSLASDGGVCRGDFMNIRSDASYAWRVYQQSIGGANGTFLINSLAAGWHHFALVGTGSSSSNWTSRLYVDGVSKGTVARKANGDKTTLGLGFIGGSCDDPATQSLRVPVDEFMVFQGSLAAADILDIYNQQASGKNFDGTTRTAASCSTVNHYAITYPNGATGSTCTPLVVRVTAHDTGDNPVAPPAGTVITMSATPAATSWTRRSDGAVSNTYTFSGTENYAEFLMSQTTVTASINVNVTDGVRTEKASEDPLASVASSSFAFVDGLGNPVTIGTQISGKPSSSSPGITLQLDAGSACAADGLTGAQSVDVAYECLNPATCSASNLLTVFPTSGSTVVQRNNAGATISYTPVTFTFDASGRAPVAFRYDDAGEIKLHFRKGGAVGAASFVVRPFALDVAVTGNPAATNPAGTVFRAAGEDFAATVRAVLWQAADDADANGLPDAAANLADNGVTPNYAWDTVLSATTPITPATGSPGVMRNDGVTPVSIPKASFSGGTASLTKLQYTEVGSFALMPATTDYINTGISVQGSGQVVGRFTPYQFAVSSTTLSHGCSGGGFTYARQPMTGDVVIMAQNKSGGRTANYRDGFDKLTASGITFINSATNAAFDALTVTMDPSNTFSNYESSLSTGKARLLMNYTWNMPLQVPTASSLKISAVNDGEVSRLGTVPIDPAAIAPTTYRFGMLRLDNAYGSDLLPIRVPIRAVYCNAVSGTTCTEWRTNTDDSGCTTLGPGTLQLGSVIKPAASALAFSVPPAGVAIVQSSPGVWTATLTPATAGVGSADLRFNLGGTVGTTGCGTLTTPVGGAAPASSLSYLAGNWCGSNYDKSATARIKFGSPKAPYIYLRERY